MGCGCFFAKGSAESHSQARQAQRRRAGHLWRHTRLVPDGATLIRPTGSSHRLIPRRPGKRSAAGQDTSGAIPVLCRMALRLSGLRGPLTGSYLVGPASAAPPGRTPQTPSPYLCRMALRLSGLRGPLTGSYLVGPASAASPGRTPQTPSPFLCRMAPRLSGLRGPLTGSYLPGPVSAAPPGKISGSIPVMLPGGGCA